MKTKSTSLTLLLAFCSLSLLCTGCGPLISFGENVKLSYYVLSDVKKAPLPSNSPSEHKLIVRETQASGFSSSHKIAFSSNPSTRSFYQRSRWLEPPVSKLTQLLTSRLRNAGIFTSVAGISSSSIGDVQLNTELVEFYHDTAEPAGEAVVILDAEYLNLNTRSIIAYRQFVKRIEVKDFSARGAVEAFNQAVSEIVSEIVSWLEVLNRDTFTAQEKSTETETKASQAEAGEI